MLKEPASLSLFISMCTVSIHIRLADIVSYEWC